MGGVGRALSVGTVSVGMSFLGAGVEEGEEVKGHIVKVVGGW